MTKINNFTLTMSLLLSQFKNNRRISRSKNQFLVLFRSKMFRFLILKLNKYMKKFLILRLQDIPNNLKPIANSIREAQVFKEVKKWKNTSLKIPLSSSLIKKGMNSTLQKRKFSQAAKQTIKEFHQLQKVLLNHQSQPRLKKRFKANSN